MKILILTNKPPFPAIDGGSIATSGLAVGLAKADNQVYIVSIETPKHRAQRNIDIPNIVVKNIFVDTTISGIRAVLNLFFSTKPYNAIRFLNNEVAQTINQLIVENNFDIVQIEGPYMMWYLELIRAKSHAKISLRAHNIEHEIWERLYTNEPNFIKKIYLRILSRRIRKFELSFLNKYDLLVPITQRDAEQFDHMGNAKTVKVIPAGITYNTYSVNPNNTKQYSICYIGALDWMPNTEGLIWFIDNVWPKLLAEFANLELHIAGRNAYKDFENYLSSQPNIIYEGEVADAAEFITKSPIQIIPLFSGSGMRVKMLEGMMLQRAIVSTRIGAEGIPVVSGENCMLADSIDEFTNEIKQLLRNTEQIEQMGMQAASFVHKNYDNLTLGKELSDFYLKHLEA